MTGAPMDLLTENMRRVNAELRRNMAANVLEAWFGIASSEVTDKMVDDWWEVVGPHLRIEMRPNPNFVPPTFERAVVAPADALRPVEGGA